MCIEPGLFYHIHPNKKYHFCQEPTHTHTRTLPIEILNKAQCNVGGSGGVQEQTQCLPPAIAQPNLFAFTIASSIYYLL